MINDTQQATIEELQKQNRELVERLMQAQSFVSTFPRQLLEARLDAKEGKQTKYDYNSHNLILRGF